MSRRTGGRPGYGWSVRQQGGFRPAEKSRLIYKRGAIEPTHDPHARHCLNLSRVRRITKFLTENLTEKCKEVRLHNIRT